MPPEPICYDFWAKDPGYARDMAHFPIFRQFFNTSGIKSEMLEISRNIILLTPGKSADPGVKHYEVLLTTWCFMYKSFRNMDSHTKKSGKPANRYLDKFACTVHTFLTYHGG